jgi:hypothetical protein
MAKSTTTPFAGIFGAGVHAPFEYFSQLSQTLVMHPPQASIVVASRRVMPPPMPIVVVGTPTLVFFVVKSTIFTDWSMQKKSFFSDFVTPTIGTKIHLLSE